MTQIFTLRRLIAASGLAAAATIAMSSMSAPASASVLDCRGTSPKAVLACCQQEVAERGRPVWMRQAHATCSNSIVQCKSAGGGGWKSVAVAAVAPGGIKKCKIVKPYNPNDTRDTPKGGDPGRGNTGNNGNTKP